MNIKAILFDNDGVMIHSKEMFSQKLSRENKILNKDIVPFFKEIFVPKCMIGKADLKEELGPWLERWKWKGTVDELLTYWFESEKNVDQQVVEYIKNARKNGIKCYLATNNEIYRTEYLRNQLGFNKLFDQVFTSAELGVKKPGVGFYNHIYTKLHDEFGFETNEILYLDDDEKNVATAKRFGFETVRYTDFQDLEALKII